MKVEIIESPTLTYPIIKRCSNFLVLFKNEKTGTVVAATGAAPYNVGYHCDYWEPSQFTPFTGFITLKND